MTSHILQPKRIHLVGVGSEAGVGARLKELSTEFDYGLQLFENTEVYARNMQDEQVLVVVLSGLTIEGSQEIAGHVQVARQISQDAFILVVMSKKISPEDATFVKKSGANLVMLDDNFFQTSQLEYVCHQMIRGALIPIKPTELHAETKIEFKVMVMMPLNRKILPLISAGATIAAAKLQKWKETSELYIRREDLKRFKNYVDAYADKTAQGIDARCRIKYLELCRVHTDLLLLLIDESEVASFGRGKELLADCENLARDLMFALGTSQDPWAILNNSSIGESGTAERSTSFAAMAGLLSLGLSRGSDAEVVMSGMLSDIGLLDLPPKIMKKMRIHGLAGLSTEELREYQQHPLASLNRCLARRLPLPEKVKEVISTTHETFDGQGFPKQIADKRIPDESYLIQFCQLVDQDLMVKMGEARKGVQEVQREILEKDSNERKRFPLELILALKRYLDI